MKRAALVLSALLACALPKPARGVDVVRVDAPGATVTVLEVPASAPGATTAVVWITEPEGGE